jgi:hypothetical protein
MFMSSVVFRRSVSQTESAKLISMATGIYDIYAGECDCILYVIVSFLTAVLYTPENEHFGIVPIEVYICLSMCVCIHTYIHTYIHIYTYIQLRVCVHSRT